MPKSNAELEELIAAINLFCDNERATARGKPQDYKAANQLRTLFKRLCPNLEKNIPDTPDVIYARRIVDYGISRKKGTVLEQIWELYYKGGSTLENLGKATDYESRTVRRYIKVFAYETATQLLEIELELSNPIQVPPPAKATIIEQKAIVYLQDHFYLTPSQAKILLAFCVYPSLNQEQFCEEVLFISGNTLKTHKKRILKQMGTTTMRPAVKQATKAMKRKFRDDWDVLFASKQNPE